MMYDASFWREREDVAQPVDGREREVRPRAVECGRGIVVEVFIAVRAARCLIRGEATSAKGR